MASLSQLQTWLTEAETARHNLATGSMVEEIHSPDGTKVRYMASDVSRLESYIAWLNAQIASQSTSAVSPRSPIYFRNHFN